MLVIKKISKVEDPLNVMKYPLDAPVPSKGDEISFGEIFGIVSIVSYVVTRISTEIHIKVKEYYYE